jgi:DNA-binding transcriptional LysR family regulator
VLPSLIHWIGISSSTSGLHEASLSFCTGCISIVDRRESLLCSGCLCRERLRRPDEDIAIAPPSQHLQVDVVTSNCPDAGLARDERRGTEMGLNKLSTSQLRRHLCRSQPYAGRGWTTAGGARNKRQADTPPASARRTTSPSFLSFYPGYVETSYHRFYTTSNTISKNGTTRVWRLQLEECTVGESQSLLDRPGRP